MIGLDENGKPGGKIEGQEYRKCLIRWVVYDTGERDEAFHDPTLFRSWIDYFADLRSRDETALTGLCAVTFENHILLSDIHPKGILPGNANAKLISSNDDENFTYRGRFRTPDEAVTIGYTASQKAHSALRWLESNQGVQIGTRRFLWWKISEDPESTPFESFGLFAGFGNADPERLKNFRDQLKNALTGYTQSGLHFEAAVIVLALAAASDGRLSVTYYHEMGAHDFAARLQK